MKTTAALLFSALISLASAADPAPDAEGWITLFNGKDLSGWMNSSGEVPKWKVTAEGTLRGDDKTGDIWTKARYGDFILEVEFKTTGNSGVFFRTADPKDNVQTGLEIQVYTPGGPSKHSVGAIYDLVAPSKNVAKDGEWNKYVITAKGPEITVDLNGERINAINVDKWTEPRKNPDGSENKFEKAVKDFAREGHVGFQDHGSEVYYRNVRLKPLK